MFKNISCFSIILLFVIPMVSAQKGPGSSLSFLEGEKSIKVEFVCDGLTISGEEEDRFMKFEVAQMNADEAGSGDKLLAEWEKAKKEDVLTAFTSEFNYFLSSRARDFRAENASEEPRYVCVIRLISIKRGVKNIVTPTCWVSYTFYYKGNREEPIAYMKYQAAYAKKAASSTIVRGVYSYSDTGSWTDLTDAFYREGKRMAGVIKKKAGLPKLKKK